MYALITYWSRNKIDLKLKAPPKLHLIM